MQWILFCRGLDAYGFSDFKRCTERMRALTSSYHINDSRRFNFGTPTQAWNTMVRCWTIEPKSERIIDDIFDYPDVLEIVISHRGAVVPEINLRHGHRVKLSEGRLSFLAESTTLVLTGRVTESQG